MTPVGVTLAPFLLALDCDASLPVLLPYCSLLVARDCHNSSISLSHNKENFLIAAIEAYKQGWGEVLWYKYLYLYLNKFLLHEVYLYLYFRVLLLVLTSTFKYFINSYVCKK